MFRLLDGGNTFATLPTSVGTLFTATEHTAITEININQGIEAKVEMWVRKSSIDEYILNKEIIERYDERIILPSLVLEPGDSIKAAAISNGVSFVQPKCRLSHLAFAR